MGCRSRREPLAAAMEMKKKIFDAVLESRKWRESTSRRLDDMTAEQRLAYLKEVGERYRAKIHVSRKASAVGF
jgi:hypothetical protein